MIIIAFSIKGNCKFPCVVCLAFSLTRLISDTCFKAHFDHTMSLWLVLLLRTFALYYNNVYKQNWYNSRNHVMLNIQEHSNKFLRETKTFLKIIYTYCLFHYQETVLHAYLLYGFYNKIYSYSLHDNVCLWSLDYVKGLTGIPEY